MDIKAYHALCHLPLIVIAFGPPSDAKLVFHIFRFKISQCIMNLVIYIHKACSNGQETMDMMHRLYDGLSESLVTNGTLIQTPWLRRSMWHIPQQECPSKQYKVTHESNESTMKYLLSRACRLSEVLSSGKRGKMWHVNNVAYTFLAVSFFSYLRTLTLK